MKKTITAIIAVLLCLCIIMPTAAFAQSTNEVSYSSVEEYVASAQNEEEADSNLKAKIAGAKFLNKLSNFFINSVLRCDIFNTQSYTQRRNSL